jgi:hypothetical protein
MKDRMQVDNKYTEDVEREVGVSVIGDQKKGNHVSQCRI